MSEHSKCYRSLNFLPCSATFLEDQQEKHSHGCAKTAYRYCWLRCLRLLTTFLRFSIKRKETSLKMGRYRYVIDTTILDSKRYAWTVLLLSILHAWVRWQEWPSIISHSHSMLISSNFEDFFFLMILVIFETFWKRFR